MLTVHVHESDTQYLHVGHWIKGLLMVLAATLDLWLIPFTIIRNFQQSWAVDHCPHYIFANNWCSIPAFTPWTPRMIIKHSFRSTRAISTDLPGCNRQIVALLKVFNDHPWDMIMSSSWTSPENLVSCKRFGAECSLLNNAWNIEASIGMVTEARLTTLDVGGFLMFSPSAISTANVWSRPGVSWWRVLNTCLRHWFASLSSSQLSCFLPYPRQRKKYYTWPSLSLRLSSTFETS